MRRCKTFLRFSTMNRNVTPPEGNYFEAMIILIEAYETKQFPRYNPTEAFKFRMEQSGD